MSGFEIVDAKEAILEITNFFIDEITAFGIQTAGTLSSIGMIEAVDIESRLWYIALCRTAIG